MSATPAKREFEPGASATEPSLDANGFPIVDLRSPTLAALLAWLIPGAGHLYQGRYFKAVLFALCILGTFLGGVCLGGSQTRGWGRVVYVEAKGQGRSIFQRLPYLCQAAAGLVAMPAIYQMYKAQDGEVRQEFMYPPVNEAELNSLHLELGRFFELGTVYTMIAGLLNILVIYDAYGGPVYVVDEDRGNEPPNDKKRRRKEDGDADPIDAPAEATV